MAKEVTRPLSTSRRVLTDVGDIVVLGGGIAGLYVALKLTPLRVTIVSAQPLSRQPRSRSIAGEIAAIAEMTPEARHAATIAAGAGLADAALARVIAEESAAHLEALAALAPDVLGAPRQWRTRAAASPGIGQTLLDALVAAVRRNPAIRIIENFEAKSLDAADGVITGVSLLPAGTVRRTAFVDLPAKAVVLATGGVGTLYDAAAPPSGGRAEGLALAARAGATIADAELVHFGAAPGDEGSPAIYHIGGVLADARGRTTVDGLWAVGEAAATGLHGAGLVPGNALLELLVLGGRIAADIKQSEPHRGLGPAPMPELPSLPLGEAKGPEEAGIVGELCRTVSACLGRERNGKDLEAALLRMEGLAARSRGAIALDNMLLSARLMAWSALQRRESRGCHVRRDFPKPADGPARRTLVRLADLPPARSAPPAPAAPALRKRV